MVVRDGAVEGAELKRAVVHNQAKLAYNSVAAWLDGEGPLPAAAAAVSGLDANLRLQDRVAHDLRRERPRARRARPADDRGAAGLLGRGRHRAARRAAQPRQAAHRGLHDRRQRRHRAVPRRAHGIAVAAPRRALAGALAAHRRGGRGARRFAARRARRARPARASCNGGRKADPERLPRPLAGDRQADGRRRVRGRGPGPARAPATSASPCATTPTRRRPTAATRTW
jgi:hypothetical protein